MRRIIQATKKLVNRVWPLRLVAFLLLRPKRFRDEFIYALLDYRRFRRSVEGFRRFLAGPIERQSSTDRPSLLIVAGQAMNAHWCQLWSVLAAIYRRDGHPVYVLTSRGQVIHNLYFRLFGVEPIYLEDLRIGSRSVPRPFVDKVEQLHTFVSFKEFGVDGVPFGRIAISTYSRLRATGIIDISDPEVRAELRRWLVYLYQTLEAARQLYQQKKIGVLFFTEVFMEEYGAFYYSALAEELNVVRFAGTVRDDAVIVQHMTRESDRTHHAAINPKSWARICEYPDSLEMDQELHQNFMDRYGDRWALSRRNQPNTRVMSVAEAKALLGVSDDRKIAVIFSHILYDTLFFFGEDLFPCYADWFVETVRAACANSNVQWFVKVHPSNLWRGELEHCLGGKYEEVRLIERYIGTLPDHVRLIYPDTPISPYTWFQITDFGVTVRGTSGIELGALGKVVITAGSGRYEDIGFTVNSRRIDEYLSVLARLPHVPAPTAEQRKLGARFAYATFCMKPFTLDFFRPVPRFGKSRIFSSDDLVFVGTFSDAISELPASIVKFMCWSADRESVDFLNEWPAAIEEVGQVQDVNGQGTPRNLPRATNEVR